MNYKRKLFRQKHKEPHCCGQKMLLKTGSNGEQFYICDKCGKVKEKWKVSIMTEKEIFLE